MDRFLDRRYPRVLVLDMPLHVFELLNFLYRSCCPGPRRCVEAPKTAGANEDMIKISFGRFKQNHSQTRSLYCDHITIQPEIFPTQRATGKPLGARCIAMDVNRELDSGSGQRG